MLPAFPAPARVWFPDLRRSVVFLFPQIDFGHFGFALVRTIPNQTNRPFLVTASRLLKKDVEDGALKACPLYPPLSQTGGRKRNKPSKLRHSKRRGESIESLAKTRLLRFPLLSYGVMARALGLLLPGNSGAAPVSSGSLVTGLTCINEKPRVRAVTLGSPT